MPGMQLISLTLTLLLGAARAFSGLTTEQDEAVATCCTTLRQQLPNNVLLYDSSTSSAYYKERTSFWSATEWLTPACVFMPETTDHVSKAVGIFSQNDCPFAIRGGGHLAIRGSANTDGGILVSMKRIKDVTFNKDKSVVTVGAGLTFGQMYKEIEKQGRIIAGGRFGTVGTGLLLGAGLSYFNNRYGLAVDNVAGHRVVLGNGTAVQTSATQNPELFWALKGGTNNFGVVSHFDLFTIENRGIHGGRVIYTPKSNQQLIDATYKYHTKTAIEELDSHVLPSFVFDNTVNASYGYLPVTHVGNATGLPQSMQYWLEPEKVSSDIKNRTFTDLATTLVAGFPDGLVQDHYSFTTYPDRDWFEHVLTRWTEFGSSLAYIPGYTGLLAMMPITPRAIAEGVRRGGNALGLNRGRPSTTLSVFYIGVTYNNPTDISTVAPAFESFIRTLEAEAKVRSLLYPFIMTTYSSANQDPVTSYGLDTLRRMAKVQERYDPSLVFQRLVTGGQKMPLRVTG